MRPKTWLITVSRHHNVEAPDSKHLLEAPNFQAALAGAYAIALQEMYGGDVEGHTSTIRDAVALVAEPAAESQQRLVSLRLPEGDQPEDGQALFLLWHDKPPKPDGRPNIGVCPGREQVRERPQDLADTAGPDEAPREIGREVAEVLSQLEGKHENRWLDVTPWDGDPGRRDDLAHLSKKQLIDLLVRREAVS